MVGNIHHRDHVTPHRLVLGWLSALWRRQYFIGLQAFKVVADAHPSYPPPPRTEAFKHSFALEAMDLINSIHFTSLPLPTYRRSSERFAMPCFVATQLFGVRVSAMKAYRPACCRAPASSALELVSGSESVFRGSSCVILSPVALPRTSFITLSSAFFPLLN